MNVPRRAVAAWSAASAAWALLIFLTLPYAPDITHAMTIFINRNFETNKGYAMVGHLAAAVLGFILVALLVRALRSPVIRTPGRFLLFAAVTAIYAGLVSVMDVPTEKLHFLEYGVLSFFLYRAWTCAHPTAAAWPAAFFTGVLIGTCDESLQHVTPRRTGEFVDILWNVVSVGLPLVIFRLFEKEPRPAPDRSGLNAIRVSGTIMAAALLAFLLFAQEWGVRILDPRGYDFNTRLPGPEELSDSRASLPPPALEDLRACDTVPYDSFLARYPASTHPRLNEFRVHLFRRDRYESKYLEAARATDSAAIIDSAAAGEAMKNLFVAERENAILEDYFGDLMDMSGTRWSEEKLEGYRRVLAGKDFPIYESAVAARIITVLPRWFVVLVGLVLIALVAFAPRLFAHAGWSASILAVLLLELVSASYFFLTTRGFMMNEPPADRASVGHLDRSFIAVFRRSMPAIEIPAAGGPVPAEPQTLRGLDGSDVDSPARFTLLCGDSDLVLRVLCPDTRIVSTLKGRDTDLWREDCVEIFIDTEGRGRRYVELEFSPSGGITDALVEFAPSIDFEASKRWDAPGLEARVERFDEGWILEARIPLASLGLTPVRLWHGIRLNVTRIDGSPLEGYVYQAWSPTRGWFHRPWRFGFAR